MKRERMVMNVMAACCLVLAVVTITGCSVSNSNSPILLSSIRSPIPGTKEYDIRVSSTELQRAISRTELVRKLRMIQLYKSVSEFETDIPEYRLFGIEHGSPYDVLGLQDADVLIAANDYIVKSPNAFVQYLGLLPQQKNAFIEVRRQGEPLILRYSIQ